MIVKSKAFRIQPSTNGIDVFDGRLGVLIDRIALPFALSINYDAVVADGKDNVLLAITGTSGSGIAVVDLSSVSEPAPLAYANAISSRSVVGIRSAAHTENPVIIGKSPSDKQRASGPLVIPHLTQSIPAPR